MRKVTSEICRAFNQGEARNIGNSSTDGVALFLHGNKIAEKRNGSLWITNAGWSTNTTKERLNGLYSVSIYQKKGVWYLNEKEWDGGWVNVETFSK